MRRRKEILAAHKILRGQRVWFTADLHLGHTNIIKYCDRPFETVEQMDNHLIAEWNSVVEHGDVVYHIGDFTLGSLKRAEAYLNALHGVIRLLPGSHDSWMSELMYGVYGERFEILPVRCEVDIGKDSFVLDHYAMQVWPASHYGSYHLFGHSHGQLPDNGTRRMDVGVDPNGFRPISADDVVKKLSLRTYQFKR